MTWKPMKTAPKDGSIIALKLRGQPDLGLWRNGRWESTVGNVVLTPMGWTEVGRTDRETEAQNNA